MRARIFFESSEHSFASAESSDRKIYASRDASSTAGANRAGCPYRTIVLL